MNTIWQYDLPTYEESKDFLYESPILVKGNQVFYVSNANKEILLHIIDSTTGIGKVVNLSVRNNVLPKEYFFVEHKEDIILYLGEFFCYHNGELQKKIELMENAKVSSYLKMEDRLFISCYKGVPSVRKSVLYSIDLNKMAIEWKIDITNEKNVFGGSYICI